MLLGGGMLIMQFVGPQFTGTFLNSFSVRPLMAWTGIPNEPDWEALEWAHDRAYGIALGEAIEQGIEMTVCSVCHFPAMLCDC